MCMKAAVVSSFGEPPRYGDVPEPAASGPGMHEMVVNVLAAGLHPRVRSQASTGQALPLVPGVDGVGVGRDGQRRYFVQGGGRPGTMAEQTVIDTWRSVPLPAACDPVKIAAGIDPAMSSWLALRHRADFRAGQDILIFGGAGRSGQIAVQAARLFGAGKVIAAARDASEADGLTAAGAARTVSLDALDLVVEAAADVDIVLDYMWGEPAATAMSLMIAARGDRARPLNWVCAGSAAGATAPVPSAMLRAAGLRITGSGQGAVGTEKILAEIPEIARCLSSGVLSVDARTVPLADVEQAWTEPADTARSIVLVP
jgi:NADPH:quinone reductase-like Zn-dependent oxidoreductase